MLCWCVWQSYCIYMLWSRELIACKFVDLPFAPSFMAKVILGIHCGDLAFEALHAPGPKLAVMWAGTTKNGTQSQNELKQNPNIFTFVNCKFPVLVVTRWRGNRSGWITLFQITDKGSELSALGSHALQESLKLIFRLTGARHELEKDYEYVLAAIG